MKRIARFWPGLWKSIAAFIGLMFVPAASASAAPCTTNCLTPGDYSVVTTSGGLIRSYLIHVPASYSNDRPVPLVLDLHGFTNSGLQQRQISGQLQQSDRRGFIAVWPDGIATSWNAYGCCGTANATGIDDVAFLRGLIASMKGRANIDANRVFVTGLSNGGAMSHRMACEAADVVRAVAPVSFPLNYDTRCNPAKPIGVTHIHGTADNVIAYYGKAPKLPGGPASVAGLPNGMQGARESLATWKIINGCSSDLTRLQLNAQTRVESYRNCKGGVVTSLVTLIDGPHVPYGDATYTPPIDIAAYIWDNVFNM